MNFIWASSIFHMQVVFEILVFFKDVIFVKYMLVFPASCLFVSP